MKLPIHSPYNGELIESIELQDKAVVEQKLATAYALFQHQAGWLPPYERIAILERTIRLMTERQEELTVLATREGGKPYTDSKIEVLRAINSVRLAMEFISQIKGEQIPMNLNAASAHRLAFTVREPIGVVLSISAFNHPLNLIVHQTVTGFAAGCPIIIKPALTTPLSCINFVKILKEAGLPEGWVEHIVCSNEVAEELVKDSRIGYFSFIGSAKVGWYLRLLLAPGVRSALEHGGAAPVIVEPDADFEAMISDLLKGGFYHAGQVCVSVQRVFAHVSIAEKLAKELANAAQKLKVGDPLDPATEVGPLILSREADRVAVWVQEAVAAGAKLLCGGRRITETLYEPTVLFNPPQDTKVSQLEVFGPVVCVYAYTDRDEAIGRANALATHFQAAVFTKNIDVALDTVKKLNATAVMVNDHTAFRVDWMPFGGRDASGIGMGGVGYTVMEMTREKMVVFKSGAL